MLRPTEPLVPGNRLGYASGVDFGRVLRLVTGFLEERGFPCAVCGAFALQAYGFSRATQDLDFVVPVEAQEPVVTVQAMKNDPGRTFQEMADIQSLLRVPGIDEEAVRGHFERHGLLERFDELKRLSG